jgi:soluble lytic murein transglycosylase
MHIVTSSLLAALLSTTCLLSGSAMARTAPSPKIRVAMPDAGLRSAFEAATRGQLDDASRAAYASHPLAGWLEYAALRHDFDTLPVERGAAFLANHRGQPVAEAFRGEWLAALAKREEWQAFLDSWQEGIDDTALRCMQLEARVALGRTDAGWTRDAQAVWRSSGRSLPNACDAPLAALATQGNLPVALRWERIDLAVAEAQSGVIRSIANGLDGDDAALANRYAAYLDAPDASATQWPKTSRSRSVASAALAKLAKSSPDRAEALLPGIADALGFDDRQRGAVLYQIALWTVASYLPDSARRLAAVPASAYDEKLHEWQVREALSRSDWPAALAAIERMDDAQRSDSRWQYFAARTSELAGDGKSAQALYRQAAQAAISMASSPPTSCSSPMCCARGRRRSIRPTRPRFPVIPPSSAHCSCTRWIAKAGPCANGTMRSRVSATRNVGSRWTWRRIMAGSIAACSAWSMSAANAIPMKPACISCASRCTMMRRSAAKPLATTSTRPGSPPRSAPNPYSIRMHAPAPMRAA